MFSGRDLDSLGVVSADLTWFLPSGLAGLDLSGVDSVDLTLATDFWVSFCLSLSDAESSDETSGHLWTVGGFDVWGVNSGDAMPFPPSCDAGANDRTSLGLHMGVAASEARDQHPRDALFF